MAHVGAAPAVAEQQDDDATPTVLTAKNKVAASLRAVGADPSTFLVPSIFSRRQAGDPSVFDVLKFRATQTVGEWRDQTKMEVTGQRASSIMPTVLNEGGMPKLFGTGMAVIFPPVDSLLIQPRPPKPGSAAYPKPPGGWPDGIKPKWDAAPKLYAPTPPVGLERLLMVRLARKVLGYCVGRIITAPTDEELAPINEAIATFFADSHSTTTKSLTAAEVEAYCYHEVALIGHPVGAELRHPVRQLSSLLTCVVLV